MEITISRRHEVLLAAGSVVEVVDPFKQPPKPARSRYAARLLAFEGERGAVVRLISFWRRRAR